MPSWCDKLASTPTIGFKLSPYVAAAGSYITAWEPLLSRLVADHDAKFSIDESGPLNWGFLTEDGFKYGASQHLVSVGFHHRMRAEPVSGGPPIMKMTSKPLLYTELLNEVSDRLIEATLMLPNVAKRSVKRVGIIAVTHVDEKDLPPGIAKLVTYLGKPWKTKLNNFSVSITADLAKDTKHSDRCIHQLVRPEDEAKLFTIQFDWQRTYFSDRSTTKDTLKSICDEAKKGAIDYFEQLAVGNMFDEALVGS
jgi:hypothetical protein